MIPLIDKNAVRIITQNITPEETEYVAGISNIISDLQNTEVSEDNCDDVIYVAKIMAFADKFRTLHWAARSMSYHKALDEFYEEIEAYKTLQNTYYLRYNDFHYQDYLFQHI